MAAAEEVVVARAGGGEACMWDAVWGVECGGEDDSSSWVGERIAAVAAEALEEEAEEWGSVVVVVVGPEAAAEGGVGDDAGARAC